jgi:hypothetical protein
MLSKTYGLNELYSGGGFTATDENVDDRTANVGAREVKVSGTSLALDPSAKGDWWDSIALGSLAD